MLLVEPEPEVRAEAERHFRDRVEIAEGVLCGARKGSRDCWSARAVVKRAGAIDWSVVDGARVGLVRELLRVPAFRPRLAVFEVPGKGVPTPDVRLLLEELKHHGFSHSCRGSVCEEAVLAWRGAG